jgi:hypothetical protein
MERFICSNEVTSVIRKEKGEFCVRSPSNPDWSGGCYPSKDKAETRLKQVEYFKHKSADSQYPPIGRYLNYEISVKVAQRFISKFRAVP